MPVKVVFNRLFVGIIWSSLALLLTAQQISAQCNTPYFSDSTRKNVTNAFFSVEKIADFNGDGKPDIAGLDRSNGNFLLLLNDGTGHLSDPITTFVGTAPSSFMAADFNNDGKIDLLVRRYTNPISVTTFLGSGNGSFTQWNTTTFNSFEVNISEKLVKFDNDARPEILAGGYYYPINSNGTLAPGNPADFLTDGDIIGDFNGDGKTDFVRSTTNETIYLNNGNATFSPTILTNGQIILSLATDLNNDGKDDLVGQIIDSNNMFRLVIFLSSSSGTFTRVDTTTPANNYFGVSVGDFNGDGIKDLVDPYNNTYYFGNANGTFTQVTLNGGIIPNSLAADFDGDGRDDFIRVSFNYYFPNATFIIQKNVCSVPKKIHPADFDGDNQSDLALWRPSDGRWSLRSSRTGTVTRVFWGLGSLGDVPTPGDYDGDGKTDVAVWRNSNGVWYIRRTSDSASQYLQWGASGDKPAQGDYDGDGIMDVAVYRPSSGVWYVRYSSTGQLYAAQFGVATDKPVPADYDGDGKTDIAVYRPSTGTWYVLKSTGGYFAAQFGIAEDKPVPADYDSDGKADLAVFRPSTSTWYLQSSLTNGYRSFQWGQSGDVAAPISLISDYTQATVYRPSEGRWYDNYGNGAYDYYDFGGADEIPVSNLPRIE